MSLLALIAAHAAETEPPAPSLPVPPYNPTAPLTIPTYDGSGQATHPDVVDAGPSGWNGYRYWMAMTPYPAANDDYENPSILASNDKTTWIVPTGLTNPVDPFPGGAYYNSDTDLALDPDTGRMWLWWRTTYSTEDCRIYSMWSTNGTTWQGKAEAFRGHVEAVLSPTVVRVGPSDWRMWCIGYNGQVSTVRTATSPGGPWSAPAPIALNGITEGIPWHVDVVRDPTSGQFHMLLNVRGLWGYVALTSTDGLTWTAKNGGGRFMAGSNWDQWPYRATMSLDDTGTVYDMWYGGTMSDLSQWWIGYTRVPRSLWTP